MAQIFISHSARDENLRNYFNRAFATSNVNAIYEEIEQLMNETITTDKVKQDIAQSSAVFVLLSQTVESLSHTRDWVGFEVGYAKGIGGAKKKCLGFAKLEDKGEDRNVLSAL